MRSEKNDFDLCSQYVKDQKNKIDRITIMYNNNIITPLSCAQNTKIVFVTLYHTQDTRTYICY